MSVSVYEDDDLETATTELNIDEILGAVRQQDINTFNKKTVDTVNREIFRVIDRNVNLSVEEKTEIYNSLIDEYYYINKIASIKRGRYVRWLRPDGKLTHGAIVINTFIIENDIKVLCRSVYGNIYFQFFFNNNAVFQKLTDSEKIVLRLNSFLQQK